MTTDLKHSKRQYIIWTEGSTADFAIRNKVNVEKQEYMRCIVSVVIDRLLFNVQWQIFHAYSGRKQVKQ